MKDMTDIQAAEAALPAVILPTELSPVVARTTGPRSANRLRALAGNRAVRGWAVAVTVYLAAVLHRSSLGVAGLLAEHRFGLSPGQLGVFVLLQLGVYAAMQVPAGVLVDRFGPRRLLLAAATTMAVAQLLFAVAPNYPTALLARTVLGAGDALTYVSVLRFASLNFAPRHFPVIIGLTGVLGSVGNVVATVPLSMALRTLGWTTTFVGCGVLSVATGALVWLALPREAPGSERHRSAAEVRAALRRTGRGVADAWATPGTRLGFWIHFSCMAATTVLGVLWGVPYLVAIGFSPAAASQVLLATVLMAVITNPIVGWIASRHTAARVPVALSVLMATVVGWLVLLLGFGAHPPHALVAAFLTVMAIGGPASGVGFSLARDYNRPARVGTAVGVVNVGGFTATIIAAMAIGGLLDLVGSSDGNAFRVAFVPVVLLQIFGAGQIVRWWRRTRASVLLAQARGETPPVRVVAHRWDIAAAKRSRSVRSGSGRASPIQSWRHRDRVSG